MKFQNKSILLISPEPWLHIFVSKHHYATHLAARGNRVYFLNPPSNQPLQIKPTEYENLFTIDYNGFVKGLRFLPNPIQRKVILNKFKQFERLCNTKFDVVWSFDNSVFFDFNALPNRLLKISHIVDLNQDFETAKAASTADICFGTTRYITDRLKKYNSNTHFINHGFNGLVSDKKVSLPGINTIKALYAGNLAMPYLDWDVIYHVVKANNGIDFIFAGPGKEKVFHGPKKMCYESKNTYFVGKVNSNELLDWYIQADVLLISYQEKYHKDQSNPHKMMEYLGSGKVVVATKTEEYQQLADEGVIAMSDENHGFLRIFQDVLSNLEHWNSQGLQERRIAYAMENTYEKQIDRIEHLVWDYE